MSDNGRNPISSNRDFLNEGKAQSDEHRQSATTASRTAPLLNGLQEFLPKICVVGVGGGGCNAINNMVSRGLVGVDFICTNTDSQHLSQTLTENRIQLGRTTTQGLGCGANPEVGRLAAMESKEEIAAMIGDAHMVCSRYPLSPYILSKMVADDNQLVMILLQGLVIASDTYLTSWLDMMP
jgi:hypothetical protein